MNTEAFAARLYSGGGTHKASDFRLPLHLIVVEPVRPPAVLSGLYVPDAVRNLPGQFALAHRVVAIARGADVALTPAGELVVGTLVKCHEAFLDPLQPNGNLLVIDVKHVRAILEPVEE